MKTIKNMLYRFVVMVLVLTFVLPYLAFADVSVNSDSSLTDTLTLRSYIEEGFTVTSGGDIYLVDDVNFETTTDENGNTLSYLVDKASVINSQGQITHTWEDTPVKITVTVTSPGGQTETHELDYIVPARNNNIGRGELPDKGNTVFFETFDSNYVPGKKSGTTSVINTALSNGSFSFETTGWTSESSIQIQDNAIGHSSGKYAYELIFENALNTASSPKFYGTLRLQPITSGSVALATIAFTMDANGPKISYNSKNYTDRIRFTLVADRDANTCDVYINGTLAQSGIALSQGTIDGFRIAHISAAARQHLKSFKVYNTELGNPPTGEPDPEPDDGAVSLAKAQADVDALSKDDLLLIPEVNGYLIDPLEINEVTKGNLNNSSISWSSSHPDIISDNGFVKRGQNDTEVTLTATATFDNQSATKDFTFIVPGKSTNVNGLPGDITAEKYFTFADSEELPRIDTKKFYADASGNSDTLEKKNGKLVFERKKYVWNTDTTAGEPSVYLYANSDGADIGGRVYTEFTLSRTREVLRVVVNDSSNKSLVTVQWEGNTMNLNAVDEDGDSANVSLNINGNETVKIGIFSDHTGGRTKFSLWVNNEKQLDNVYSSAKLANGISHLYMRTLLYSNYSKAGTYTVDNVGFYSVSDSYVDSPVEKPDDRTDLEKFEAACALITEDNILTVPVTSDGFLADPLDLDVYSGNVEGVNVTWTSSHPEIISSSGKLTRPDIDTDVTVTALISIGEFSQEISFTYTVPSLTHLINDIPADVYPLMFDDFSDDTISSNIKTSNFTDYDTLLEKNGKLSFNRVAWEGTESAVRINQNADGSRINGEYMVEFTLRKTRDIVRMRMINNTSFAYMSQFYWQGDNFTLYYSDDNGNEATKTITIPTDEKVKFTLYTNMSASDRKMTIWINNEKVLDNVNYCQSVSYISYVQLYTLNYGSFGSKGNYTVDNFGIYRIRHDMTDSQRVQMDAAALNAENLIATFAPMEGTLFEDLNLPAYGENGSFITWESSDTSIISNNGKVTRPSNENISVTITATVSYKTASVTKDFTYEVLGEHVTIGDVPEIESLIVENDFESETTENHITTNTAGGGTVGIDGGKLVIHKTGGGTSQVGATIYNTDDITKAATGVIGVSYDITRESTTPVQIRSMDANGNLYYSKVWSGSYLSVNCSDDPAVSGNERGNEIDSGNTLHVDMMFDTKNSSLWVWANGKQIITEKYSRNIGVGAICQTMYYLETNNKIEIDNYKVYHAIPPKALRLRFDTRDITPQDFYSGELLAGNAITQNLNLPSVLRYGTTVEWASSNEDYISASGTVTRPVDTEQNPVVTLTADFENSNMTKFVDYTYSVLREFSDHNLAAKSEVEDITHSLLTDEDSDKIKKSLNFFEVGPYGSKVTWTSSNQSVITNAGRVIRPRFDEEDVTVTVTAHIGAYKKDLEFTVLADEPPKDPMHTSDEDFFGVWNGISFNKTPQLDYSLEGLSKVRDAAKIGDYSLAKQELYNYFLTRNVPSPVGLSARIPGWVESRLEGVYELSEAAAYYRGQINVTSDTYEQVVIPIYKPSTINKINGKSFEILARYNESTAAYILGTDADNPNMVPMLELTVNGEVRSYRATGSATIRAGKYVSTHYGDNKTLTAKMFGDFLGDETYRILLSFDLGDIPSTATISSAQLTIYARKSSPTAPNKQLWLMECKNDSWNEETVYWDNLNFALHNYNGLVGGYNWSSARATDIEFGYQAPRFMHVRQSLAEYKYTNDEKYAYMLLQQILDFITDCGDQTPYPRSLDAGLRMHQWVPLMNNIVSSKYLTPEFCTAFLKYMYAQYEYFPKRGDATGNWREYEQLALFYATISYPELSNTKITQDACILSWQNAFEKSFLPDGTYVEDTGGYASSVVQMYRDFLKNCQNYNIDVPDEFIENFRNATYFLSLFQGPGGELLSYGDQGRGKSSPGFFADIADMLGDYELKFIDSFGSQGTEPSYTSYQFPEGVTTMMRSDWRKDATYIYTNVRGGGQGHSHADDNGIIVIDNGRTHLADSGKFTYSSYDPARMYGLSTKAHNTVVINDTSQRDMWLGSSNALSARGTINSWKTNSEFDFLSQTTKSYPEHDHTRNIFFIKDGFFVVSDHITPHDLSTSNNYKQYWHMMPEADLTVDSDANSIYSNYSDGKNIILSTADDVNSVMELGYFDVSGNTPIDNAKVGYFEKDVVGKATIDTVAYLTNFPGATLTTEQLSTGKESYDATAIKFVITDNGKTESYYYMLNHSYNGTEEITFGEYKTDARVALVGLDSDGKVIKAVITDGSYIKKGSETIALVQTTTTDISLGVVGTRLEVVSSDTSLLPADVSFYSSKPVETATFNKEGREFTQNNGVITLSNIKTDETNLPGDDNKNSGIIVPEKPEQPKPSEPSSGHQGGTSGGAVTPTPGTQSVFTDINSHWAEAHILSLGSKGIVNGMPDGTFGPDRTITRSEFTAIAIRTIRAPKAQYMGGFTDVTSSDWFSAELQTAVNLGIISKADTFRPNDSITRQEMAKILTQCAKYLNISSNDTKILEFNDSYLVDEWAVEYVEYVVSNGLMNGKDGNIFDPTGNATRAETATVFDRLISK